MQKIAAGGREIAQLRTCAGKQGLAQNRVTRGDERVLGQIRISDQSADSNPALVRQFFHLGERQAIDINETIRRFHAHFHQVNQVGAAANKFGLWIRRDPVDRALPIGCARIFERPHAPPPILSRACLIASTMLG